MSLDALLLRVRDEIARTAHPRAPWLAPRTGPDGQPAHDVIVVGAGQSGLAIAFGLMRAQVTNILVLDRAPKGWRALAHLCADAHPAQPEGLHRTRSRAAGAHLQSWHEARYGAAAWEART